MSDVLPPDWTKFHVGQEVVCVDDRIGATECCSIMLKSVYTIASLFVAHDHTFNMPEQLVCTLREIACPRDGKHYYGLWRFRPVRNTNIDVFREMCRKSPSQNERELETAQ